MGEEVEVLKLLDVVEPLRRGGAGAVAAAPPPVPLPESAISECPFLGGASAEAVLWIPPPPLVALAAPVMRPSAASAALDPARFRSCGHRASLHLATRVLPLVMLTWIILVLGTSLILGLTAAVPHLISNGNPSNRTPPSVLDAMAFAI